MREGRPSATAHRVALRRAAHQLLDRPPVLADPLALRVIGERAAAELRAGRGRGRGQSPLDRVLRAFLAARGRFAEETLAAGVARGLGQYVLLGAGLDTFAYRSPHAGLRVFEADHPATQAWKRALLAEGGVAVPETLVFVPVDFERDTLEEALTRVGFRRAEPALFAMLGVVPYLTREALEGTWRLVAAGAPGSELVFDYAIPPERMGPRQRAAFAALARRVALAGEAFRTTFAPEDLATLLRTLGFRDLEDLDPAAIHARWFAGRTDGLTVGGAGRLMRAST